MKTISRYIMTLALLLTAVTGAWAQSSPDAVEFEVPADWENDDSKVTAADLPGFKAVTLAEAKAWTGAPKTGGAVLVYAFDGNKACVVPFRDGTALQEAKTTYAKKVVFGNKSLMKFYYTGEITEWPLTSKDGKNWTLAKMPANDIELQVEYFAESNLFLGKEALADKANISVLNGETAVEFDADGKSTATVTEGNTVTAKFTGKKVLGMKVAKAADNTYLKWDAVQKKLVATEFPAEVTTVENANADVNWAAGTYVVEGEVTINGKITLNGNVDLIIKDGATLTAQRISGNMKNLSIYGQAQKKGELVVVSSADDAFTSLSTLEVHSAKVTATSSKDGRGGFFYIGTFNVYGGEVDAKNTGTSGYGIILKAGGFMNIFGGEVKAVGKGNNTNSNGINGGASSNKATVTVYGGKLYTESADDKALNYVNLQKGEGFTGMIEYSSDNSTWSETVDASAKYVRAGY